MSFGLSPKKNCYRIFGNHRTFDLHSTFCSLKLISCNVLRNHRNSFVSPTQGRCGKSRMRATRTTIVTHLRRHNSTAGERRKRLIYIYSVYALVLACTNRVDSKNRIQNVHSRNGEKENVRSCDAAVAAANGRQWKTIHFFSIECHFFRTLRCARLRASMFILHSHIKYLTSSY